MIATFIRLCHQFILSIPFKFAFALNEADENDPFGRNIQAAMIFLQPKTP